MAFVSSLKTAVMRGWRDLLQFFKRKPPSKNEKADFKNFYRVLRSYYDLDLNVDGYGRIRNPARRVVEFYPAHLFPGQDLEDALPVDTSKMDEDFLKAVKDRRRNEREQELADSPDGESPITSGFRNSDVPPAPQPSAPQQSPLRTNTTNGQPPQKGVAPTGVPGVQPFGPPPKSADELEREREEEINPKSERLKEAVYQILKWSNFADQKQVYARVLARDGDVFLKSAVKTAKVPVQKKPKQGIVALDAAASEVFEEEPDLPDEPIFLEEAKSVYIQLVDPVFVTDFDTDERDFLTMVRIDTPQAKGAGGYPKAHTHTELWSKEDGDVKVWRHEKKPDEDPEKLPPPVSEIKLEKIGIDFVPIVHAKFQDAGLKRGVGAYATTLDKFDEWARLAQRKNDLFFRYQRPVWALQGIGNDASGRPIAPPRIDPSAYTAGAGLEDEYSQNSTGGAGDGDYPVIELGKDAFVRLPGNTQLAPLVPPLDWTAADEAEDRLKAEIEADQPELAMNRIRQEMSTELSGRSVKFQLSDAIDKAVEARGNAESALVKAIQHCLTLAQENGLEGFGAGEIGTFDDGDFEFTFKEREIMPLNEDEEAEGELKKLTAVEKAKNLGGEKLGQEVGHKFGYDSIEFQNNPLQVFGGAPGSGALERSKAVMEAAGAGKPPKPPKTNKDGELSTQKVSAIPPNTSPPRA